MVKVAEPHEYMALRLGSLGQKYPGHPGMPSNLIACLLWQLGSPFTHRLRQQQQGWCLNCMLGTGLQLVMLHSLDLPYANGMVASTALTYHVCHEKVCKSATHVRQEFCLYVSYMYNVVTAQDNIAHAVGLYAFSMQPHRGCLLSWVRQPVGWVSSAWQLSAQKTPGAKTKCRMHKLKRTGQRVRQTPFEPWPGDC